jgi:transcriptional regulator with XRE-family HTH domain
MAGRREALARRRRALGHTQESLAEQLDVTPLTVRRWEAGTYAPSPVQRRCLARLLDVSLPELDELLFGTDQDLDTPDSHVDPEEVVAELRWLQDAYDRSPSASLLVRASGCLWRAAALRQQVWGTGARRRAAMLESEAAILMGQLVWDASQRRDHTGAVSCFRRALTASRQAGDAVLEALALLRCGYVSLYGTRDGRHGYAAARRAAIAANRVSPALSSLALVHAAEGAAMLGDRRGCEYALEQARRLAEDVAPSDPAAKLVSPEQFGRVAGSCYLSLGQPKVAHSVLETAASAATLRHKSRSIVLGNLSLACARQKSVEEATVWLNQALDVVEETWGAAGLQVAFTAGRELYAYRDLPCVRDSCDRLFALIAAP